MSLSLLPRDFLTCRTLRASNTLLPLRRVKRDLYSYVTGRGGLFSLLTVCFWSLLLYTVDPHWSFWSTFR